MAALTRRRAIAILACAAGLSPRAALSAPEAVRWRGMLLGAPCAVDLLHPEPVRAQEALDAALSEARRLEGLFSLYRPDSALCELNRVGVLLAPDADFVALLRVALDYARRTNGVFDPTVQPLFELMRAHFSRPGADPAGPPPEAREAARALVGATRILVRDDRVALPRGAALTLNGVAQGYVTDRVAAVLSQAGMSSALIDMGEVRCLGLRPDGGPWRVALEAPDGRLFGEIDCVNRAVATSAGGGFLFDAAGRFNHLFDPRTGDCARRFLAVSVLAPTAVMADALSTAFSLMVPAQIESVLAEFRQATAYALDHDGGALARFPA